MTRSTTMRTTLAALLALAAAIPASASASAGNGGAAYAPNRLVVKFDGQRFGRSQTLPPGVDARRAVVALRRNERVRYATLDHVAHASAWIPNDSGRPRHRRPVGGWVSRQWSFLPWEKGEPGVPTSPGGINAVGAWRNLIAAGRPGAKGVKVAVLDTGVAYRSFGRRFRRSPDFSPRQFVQGHDFVGGDRLPLDHNGHGTHIAATIAERTNNRLGLTGLAYKAKLMPIRVLDGRGAGLAGDIAKGIRFAASQGARVINMSFNFACGRSIRVVEEAIRFARRKGAVPVASVGNRGAESCVSAPATSGGVIGVGGATRGGCIGGYSLTGADVDLLGPGGGAPQKACAFAAISPILQVTLRPRTTLRFGLPGIYSGTSMAAAHVSGVAAMTIASGVLGKRPSPAKVAERLTDTARDLGLPPSQQGAGLLDAGAATNPGV